MANLCALCSTCHGKLHDGDRETRIELGWHIALRRSDTFAYLVEKLGAVQARDFLRRSYGDDGQTLAEVELEQEREELL